MNPGLVKLILLLKLEWHDEHAILLPADMLLLLALRTKGMWASAPAGLSAYTAAIGATNVLPFWSVTIPGGLPWHERHGGVLDAWYVEVFWWQEMHEKEVWWKELLSSALMLGWHFSHFREDINGNEC